MIEVSKEKFSSVYPAMWFSPGTGEVVPLTSRSEVPPKPEFECWIEPGDPEFAFQGDEHGLFLYAGAGENSFTSPVHSDNAKSAHQLQDLVETSQVASLPVYYARSHRSPAACFIQIITWDKNAQVIRFRWRPATESEVSEFSHF